MQRRSLITFAIFVVFLLLMCVAVHFFDAGPLASQFKWPIVVIVCAAAGVGLILTRRARIPEMWERPRFFLPVAIGALFGMVTAIHAALRPGHGPITPFPASLLVFTAGGLLIELMLRQFALTTLAAVFPNDATFWIAATITSLYEPLPFITGGSVTMSSVLVAVRLLAFNLVAAGLYRRFGFLAALSERYGEYAVWHIIGQSFLGLH